MLPHRSESGSPTDGAANGTITIRRQLRVYTAQGRMTGYLLSALPIILFSILYMLNPSYMSILFTDPIGKILIGVGISMQLVGFLWIRKIINIEI